MKRLKYSSVFLMIVFLAFSVFASSYKDERNPNTKNEDLFAGDPDTLRVTLGADVGLELVASIVEIAGMEKAWDIAFSPDGNYAYVTAKGQNAPVVWVMSISEPANPSVVGSLEIPNPRNLTPEAWGVKVVGNHLYIAAYNCGLWIYDIKTPVHPTPVGSYYDEKSESRGLYVSGNYCYVADAWNGLSIYDVTNSSSPQRLSQYNTVQDISSERAEFHDVKVFGNLAYCAAGNHGLVIVDVSDPVSPKGVSFCCDCVRHPRHPDGLYDWGRAVEVSGNYAYLGDNNAGLRIVDISQPAHPVEVGVYKVEGGEKIWKKYGGGEVWKIEVVGDYVYIPYDNFDFRVVDISNPSHPVEVGLYPIVGRSRAIGVRDRYAYVIEESSFWVIDIEKLQGGLPTEGNYERKILEIAECYPAISLKAMGKLVEWHFQNGRFQRAMEVYEEAINRFSGILLPLSTLQKLAEWHIENDQAEKAEQIYLMAIGGCEETTYALKAQQWLITFYIRLGKENEAKTALDKLVADFSRHPDLPWALYEIGDRYEGVGKYEEAEKVYQRVIQGYPDSKFATDARLRIQKKRVISCIDSGDEAGAKAALNKLTVDLSQHPGLPWALYEIGYTYGRVGKYEDAKRIYQEIIEKYPDNDYAIKAQLEIPKDVVLSYIDLGDNTRAEETFDKLIADFSEHPDLPRAIDNIEEGYYNKILAEGKCPTCGSTESVYFEKAIEVWEKVMERFPDFFFDDSYLYIFIGTCYINLGKYEKAIEELRKVPMDRPNEYIDARLRIAWILSDLAIYEKAERELLNLLNFSDKMSPSMASFVLYNLACFYDHRLKDYNRAKSLYKKIISKHSSTESAIDASIRLDVLKRLGL